jgi:hypothetical protein
MIERSFQGNEIFFIIYVIIFMLLGILRQSERERFQVFVRSFTNANSIEQQIRQERSFLRVGIFVFLISLNITSVFLAQAIHFKGWLLSFSFGALFSLIIVGLLLFTAFRMAIYTALGWLFEVEDLLLIHTFHWLQSSFIWALVLLPVSILFTYGSADWQEHWLNTGLIIGLILFLIRSLRVFSTAASGYRISVIYNIFYLCALEFLPLAVVITVIFRQQLG